MYLMTRMLRFMRLNFRPFPSIWLKFLSHRALPECHQPLTVKSAQTFLTVNNVKDCWGGPPGVRSAGLLVLPHVLTVYYYNVKDCWGGPPGVRSARLLVLPHVLCRVSQSVYNFTRKMWMCSKRRSYVSEISCPRSQWHDNDWTDMVGKC